MARSFADSSSDRMVSNNTVDLGTSGTMSIWFKPNWSSGDSATRYIWDGGSDLPRFTHVSSTFFVMGFSGGGNSQIVFSDTGLVSSGVWAHWALTWSAAAGQAAYHNGTSVGTGTFTAFSDIVLMTIGTDATGSFSCNGATADFGLWSTVLTTLELQGLAKGARPGAIRPSLLQLWYPIDGIQSSEPDLSGNKNNASLVGTALAFGAPLMMFTPRRQQFTPPVLPPPLVPGGFAAVEW